MPKPMLPPLQPPTRPQIQQINKTTPIQYIQQAPFQFLQQTPIHQIQQMPNIQQCIQQASNIHNMPQQVFFLSNPNDFNLNFAPKQDQQQTQPQLIKIPQFTSPQFTTVNCVNSPPTTNVNINNKVTGTLVEKALKSNLNFDI